MHEQCRNLSSKDLLHGAGEDEWVKRSSVLRWRGSLKQPGAGLAMLRNCSGWEPESLGFASSGLDTAEVGGGEMAAGRDKVYHQRQCSPRTAPAPLTSLFHNTRRRLDNFPTSSSSSSSSPRTRRWSSQVGQWSHSPQGATGTRARRGRDLTVATSSCLNAKRHTHRTIHRLRVRDPCLNAPETRVDLPNEWSVLL